MPNLRWQELLIIVVLVVLLFGAKRLPDAARGLGRSLRIFKAETKGLHEENAQSAVDSAPPARGVEAGSSTAAASEGDALTNDTDRAEIPHNDK